MPVERKEYLGVYNSEFLCVESMFLQNNVYVVELVGMSNRSFARQPRECVFSLVFCDSFCPLMSLCYPMGVKRAPFSPISLSLHKHLILREESIADVAYSRSILIKTVIESRR